MVTYRTTESLIENRKELSDYYGDKVSWAIRSGDIFEWIDRHIAKNASILDLGAAGGACLAGLKKLGYDTLSGVDVDNSSI